MAGDNCEKLANIPGAEKDCRLHTESQQHAWGKPEDRKGSDAAAARTVLGTAGFTPTINESGEKFLNAAKQFYAPGDQHKSLQQLDPTLQDAMNGATAAYQKAFTKAQGEMKASGGDLNKSVANLNDGTNLMLKEINKFPPETQAQMQQVIEGSTPALASAYDSKGRNSPEGQAAREQFEKKMSGVVGPEDAKTIMTAVDKSYDALKDPGLKKYVQDVMPVQMKRLAMLDAYSQMAHVSGDAAKDHATQLQIAQIESTLPGAVQKSRADDRAMKAAVDKKLGIETPNGALDDLSRMLHQR